mmetsp:Transcript_9365/g.18909  ORF Transcript_9365/g.18909 Transcript_9365/m.18909 type:complete len:440 (+) Transcript_9365:40-1359(+)
MKPAVNLFAAALFVVTQARLIVATTASKAPPLAEHDSSPIVFIPGFAASVLEVQYDYESTSPPRFWCAKSSQGKWERVWGPRPIELLPKVKDCWWHKIKVYYSPTIQDEFGVDNSAMLHEAHSAPGVQLRVKPGTDGLEVEPNVIDSNVYRQLLHEFPETQVLTYDFRLSPTGNPHVVQQILDIIEDVSWRNNAKPVTILSHSYGALLVHHVLTKVVSNAWKERYIHAWIPMAPAYGGVTEGLQDVVSGDTRTLNPCIRDNMYKETARSFEASFWMLPHPAMYANDTLVELHVEQNKGGGSITRHYTAGDYAELFKDAGFANFPFMWQRIQNLTDFSTQATLADPGVSVCPIYGTGIETVVKYVYDESFDTEPDAITDWSGDGTIQRKGLTAGNHWTGVQTPLELVNTTHIGVCWHPDALDYIRQVTRLKSTTGSFSYA